MDALRWTGRRRVGPRPAAAPRRRPSRRGAAGARVRHGGGPVGAAPGLRRRLGRGPRPGPDRHTAAGAEGAHGPPEGLAVADPGHRQPQGRRRETAELDILESVGPDPKAGPPPALAKTDPAGPAPANPAKSEDFPFKG